jgi:hypothetical protein
MGEPLDATDDAEATMQAEEPALGWALILVDCALYGFLVGLFTGWKIWG